MTKRKSSAADLIAASVVASSVSRPPKRRDTPGCPADCTGCPFSLDVFALSINEAKKAISDAKRKRKKT
jgi:hypothetical protein